MKTTKKGKKYALHTIQVTPDYVIHYLYKLVKPFNIGLNVYCDLFYLGVVRESGSICKTGGVQCYNPRISDYTLETHCKTIYAGIRYLIKSS